MFWFFNAVLGILFLLAGSILGYSYYTQKINGLSLAMTLFIIDAGLLRIASTLIHFGFALEWIAILAQMYLIVIMSYLVWELYDNTQEAEQQTEKRSSERKADKPARYPKLRD